MKYLIPLIFLTWHRLVWCSSWLIVANGSPIPIDELHSNLLHKKSLFLDGAVNCLEGTSIHPNCILGDFDSVENLNYWGIRAGFSEIDELTPSYEGNYGITIIPAKDQSYTDLEKGIIYCDSVGATSIVILQATGGRMDHTLGNLGLLKKYYNTNRKLSIETEKERIIYLSNGSLTLEGGIGQTCAIMGYPKAKMTTSGLLYNGTEYLLEIGVQESTCNTIYEPKATISITGNALIILPKSSAILKLGTF